MTSIVVAGGIIWQDDHLLAALRPQGKPMAGYWEFPGGKLEPGETAEQALCRELREELGISVRACRLWQIVEHDYAERDLHVQLHFFHVTAFDGTPCARERQELRWVTPAQARDLPFLPADATVDGVHFTKAWYQKWLAYLMEHTVDAEVYQAGVAAAEGVSTS